MIASVIIVTVYCVFVSEEYEYTEAISLFKWIGITTEYIEVQDFVCEVASCLYKHCPFLTDNQPEIHSTS